VSHKFSAFGIGPLENPRNRIKTHIEVLERRSEGDTNEVVARRVEKVAPVRWVDVEEDARDDDGLFLEKLFEERQTVVERLREVLEVEPDVEGRLGRDVDVEAKFMETLENVVALHLEVLLKSEPFYTDVLGIQEGNSRELQGMAGTTVQEGS